MIKIAFFDTKDYDKKFFNEYNKNYGYEIKYIEEKLCEKTAYMSKGYDVVCVFVNDIVDEKTINILLRQVQSILQSALIKEEI